MNEVLGTLLTFLPLIVVIVLANLADRERDRAARSEGNVLVMASGTVTLAGDGSPPVFALDAPPANDPTYPDLPEGAIPVKVIGPAEPSSSGGVFAALAYFALGMVYALCGAIGLMILAVTALPDMPEEVAAAFATMNSGVLGWGLAIASLLGMVVLLRPVRRMLASFLPIDPLRTVHAVALSMVALVLIQTVFVVGVGIDTMAEMMTQSGTDGADAGAVSVMGAWFSALMMVLLSALGVGWLIRRSGRQTLIRLGIAMPSGAQVLISLVVGVLMVGVIIALEWVSVALGWGIDEDVAELTEQLLGGLMTTLPGVLTIGLAAGIGEETLMRGAVQPRLGLLLTSATFALLHANYGITLSTLAVFIVGLALGLVRHRLNTTSAMIVHATYNIIFGLMAYFAITPGG